MNWFVLCSLFGIALGQGINDVALIVGGIGDNALSNLDILSSVEIFGCPSGESVVVDDFPLRAYFTAGIYLSEEDAVLLCGGFACDKEEGNEQDCNVEDKCFKWNPESGWQTAASLSMQLWSHILASGPNLKKPGDNAWAPMTFGIGSAVGIFDNDEQAWVQYRDIPAIISGSCLVQEGSKVYFSDTTDQLSSLDLFTWEITSLANLPPLYASTNAGQCTIA